MRFFALLTLGNGLFASDWGVGHPLRKAGGLPIWLFGFQWGVTIASSDQLGLPA